MKRIFIAINLPEEIIVKLASVQQEIIGMYPENLGMKVAKWVKKENLHITLCFIGEVEDKAILRANEVLKERVKNHGPISIIFNRACYGPAGKMPPRLVWVEIEENPLLSELAKTVKSAMVARSILERPDKRPFQGHITLGRIREWQWKHINPEERPDIEQDLGIEFEVKSIELMESVLRREGAEYAILKSFNFIHNS